MTFELVLDVAIGLVLVFALFSLLTSTIVELISAMLRRRGRMLEFGIAQIFGEESPKRSLFSQMAGGKSYAAFRTIRAFPGSEIKSLTERFYELAPIKALMDGDRLPSYVSKDAFVSAIMTLIHEDLEISNPDPDYGAAARLDEENPSPLAGLINELFPTQAVTRAMLEKRLRVFYEDATDRINGWYGKETQFWLLGVGALVAVIFNVNSIYIASELATNANLREQYAVMASSAEITALAASVEADAAAGEGTASDDDIVSEKREQFDDITGHISKLTLPVGRCRGFVENDKNSAAERPPSGGNVPDPALIDTSNLGTPCASFGWNGAYSSNLFVEVVGWAITAFAISLGAPFWFDLMSKLVAIRRAGKLREANKKEDEETENGETKPLVVVENGAREEPSGEEGARSPNQFERENLSKDDIKAIQRLLGVADSGDLDSAPTRQAIAAWKSVHAHSAPNGYLAKDVVVELFNEGVAPA